MRSTGARASATGRLIIPGRQTIGWILTFALGLLGAFIGGFLAEGMDLDVWWQVLIVQVVVAAILVLLVSMLARGRVQNRHRTSHSKTAHPVGGPAGSAPAVAREQG